jgi:hypothetical protein
VFAMMWLLFLNWLVVEGKEKVKVVAIEDLKLTAGDWTVAADWLH